MREHCTVLGGKPSSRRENTVPTAIAPRPPGKGICRAIFAVTGVVDEVSDLIAPGAFANTLATRTVKAVWHHEWKDPVGVVLEIAEWLPGDSRFASIPDWPAEAGALVATIGFNLRTQRGRDVYEQVAQWHAHGQAQFSIGYRVPRSTATKRSDGVRVIHRLDLYEISPVLHGAHPMTRALEVKATADGGMERKATAGRHLDVKTAEEHVGRGAMVAFYVPIETASQIAHPQGTPARDLHVTLAYLGDAEELPGHPDDLANLVATALDGEPPVAGRIGGLGRFPDTGDGDPVFVPVDVPGLDSLRQRIVGAIESSALAPSLDGGHGFLPHITLGYGLPLDTAPVPQLPVAFDTVHVVRGRDSTPVRLRGPAVPSDAPGPAGTAPSRPTLAPAEQKSARHTVHQARTCSPPFGTSARAAVLEAKSLGVPVPSLQPLPASFEDVRERVTAAVRSLLVTEEGTWCCVEATYPDRVIVSVHRPDADTQTYSVPYTSDGAGVSLGTAQLVELATVVIPDKGAIRPADHVETTDSRVVRPLLHALGEATARVQAAGSAERLEPVRASVTDLLTALSAKGLDIPRDAVEAAGPARTLPPSTSSGIDLWDDPYDEPHNAADEGAHLDDADEEEETYTPVRLGAEEVQTRLAAIQP
ncbi:2'-5' RNA ligase family protein [Streptomyces sp. NPDC093249]|uniref:2'-5' RNA ligase family protein n=1 Tax=unclassified Streptomyces TaxID=2593676 RepID=UPI00344DEBDA